MKILVVEDERRLADSLGALLRQKGFAVDVVYDGEAGQQYAALGVYDLLILDVMLPKLDGFTLARQLRASHLGTPILMLTARSGLEDRITGLNSGADYYLPKPFDARELMACVNALLRRQGAQVDALTNDEMKGRIIGREGRNIRALENLTGVDLIIDDTPEAITLSSHDPVRREVARIALERLIQDGRIHPARIEEMVEKAKREVDNKIKQDGERAVAEAGIHNIHPELVRLLGRMRYRSSYGQNVLEHSLEVSHLAGMMAAELGADVKTARRAGLLHDIGKALTHEIEGSHVQIGVDVARKYKESPEVIHAIEAHHNDVEPRTIVAALVQAADAISAARPGARRENVESYIKRLEKLEEIAKSFDGVESCYAIQAGREIRIMIKPEVISDDRMPVVAREIVQKIESEMEYPGQIKVNLIRETRSVDFAK